MSELWSACVVAGPLESFPDEIVRRITKKIHDYYHAFKYYRRIRREENAHIESYDEYQQTWDECVDFLYHNPGICRLNIEPDVNLLHKSARYVYNDSDLDLLERRLQLQLHVLHASMDHTILHLYTLAVNSEPRRNSVSTTSDEDYPDDDNLPTPRSRIEKNTLRLFLYLKLNRKPKDAQKFPLNSHQHHILWDLVVTRFKKHALHPNLLFAHKFPLSIENRKALKEYADQTFAGRQRTYRQEVLVPTLRRRVYTFNENSSLIFKMGPLEDEDELYFLDIVTKSGSAGWIVGSKMSREWGIVQYLPTTNDFHLYTNHKRFEDPEVRIYEPCQVIETCDGSIRSYANQEPTYLFSDQLSSAAFQSAVKGKFLQQIFQVDELSFTNGPASRTAQPLRLWSDFNGRNRVLSFLVPGQRPNHLPYYIDVPLMALTSTITVDGSLDRITLEFSPPERRRSTGQTLAHFMRRWRPANPRRLSSSQHNTLEVAENRPMITESGDEELESVDSQFFFTLGRLKIRFSTPQDLHDFEMVLRNYFKRKHNTRLDTGTEKFNSSDEESSLIPRTTIRQPPLAPPTKPLIRHLSPTSDLNNNNNGPTREDLSRGPAPLPVMSKDLKDVDYRIKGIKMSCDIKDLPSLLRRKLKLADDVDIRVKSLAVNHTRESKVAVVALRPRPERFSKPEPGEWIVDDDDDDNQDIERDRLTIDRHFRGVTVLYAPEDRHYDIDICAVAGLGGHAWGSFKHRNASSGQPQTPQASFMWILDAIPILFPTARVMTYGSKTKLDGSQSFQTLKELGAQLRGELKTVRRRQRTGSVISIDQPYPRNHEYIPSLFIAHSLGGLTLKEALLQEAKNPERGSFLENLHGAIFFGVPMHGMKTRVLEAMVRGQPNEPLVQSIRDGSETLIQLSADFKSASFKYGKPKIAYFYELEKSFAPERVNGQWQMTGEPKIMLVKKDSATDGIIWDGGRRAAEDGRAVTTIGLNRDHSGLVKFSSREDPDLQQALSELQGLVEHALNRAQEVASLETVY